MSGEYPKRGEIYWVDFEPTYGGETKKRRPALVVSNDIGNELSKVVSVAPISSKVTRTYPFEVKTVVAKKDAKIMLNQCRAIDKSRLGQKIGTADPATMDAVVNAIKIVYAIP